MVEAYCEPVVQTDLNKRVQSEFGSDDGCSMVALCFYVSYESIDWLMLTDRDLDL